jgi:hypothetical protein
LIFDFDSDFDLDFDFDSDFDLDFDFDSEFDFDFDPIPQRPFCILHGIGKGTISIVPKAAKKRNPASAAEA